MNEEIKMTLESLKYSMAQQDYIEAQHRLIKKLMDDLNKAQEGTA